MSMFLQNSGHHLRVIMMCNWWTGTIQAGKVLWNHQCNETFAGKGFQAGIMPAVQAGRTLKQLCKYLYGSYSCCVAGHWLMYTLLLLEI